VVTAVLVGTALVRSSQPAHLRDPGWAAARATRCSSSPSGTSNAKRASQLEPRGLPNRAFGAARCAGGGRSDDARPGAWWRSASLRARPARAAQARERGNSRHRRAWLAPFGPPWRFGLVASRGHEPLPLTSPCAALARLLRSSWALTYIVISQRARGASPFYILPVDARAPHSAALAAIGAVRALEAWARARIAPYWLPAHAAGGGAGGGGGGGPPPPTGGVGGVGLADRHSGSCSCWQAPLGWNLRCARSRASG
jgi:hypothetical protein